LAALLIRGTQTQGINECLHDGGIRVPYIVSWPGRVPEGKVDEISVIHGTDWLPTVALFCNVELPEGLYDIVKDPAEKENLAGQNPTVAANIEMSIQQLQKEMDQTK
jgi:arylsulfatase A-like enzyme